MKCSMNMEIEFNSSKRAGSSVLKCYRNYYYCVVYYRFGSDISNPFIRTIFFHWRAVFFSSVGLFYMHFICLEAYFALHV